MNTNFRKFTLGGIQIQVIINAYPVLEKMCGRKYVTIHFNYNSSEIYRCKKHIQRELIILIFIVKNRETLQAYVDYIYY